MKRTLLSMMLAALSVMPGCRGAQSISEQLPDCADFSKRILYLSEFGGDEMWHAPRFQEMQELTSLAVVRKANGGQDSTYYKLRHGWIESKTAHRFGALDHEIRWHYDSTSCRLTVDSISYRRGVVGRFYDTLSLEEKGEWTSYSSSKYIKIRLSRTEEGYLYESDGTGYEVRKMYDQDMRLRCEFNEYKNDVVSIGKSMGGFYVHCNDDEMSSRCLVALYEEGKAAHIYYFCEDIQRLRESFLDSDYGMRCEQFDFDVDTIKRHAAMPDEGSGCRYYLEYRYELSEE